MHHLAQNWWRKWHRPVWDQMRETGKMGGKRLPKYMKRMKQLVHSQNYNGEGSGRVWIKWSDHEEEDSTWPVVKNKADVCSLDFSWQQWEIPVQRYTNLIQDNQASEVVSLPHMSSHLREAAVRPFGGCYNHTTQNLRCPQSMKSKKEITNPLAPFLENPNDSKSINHYRVSLIHLTTRLIHF